jgi:hypothetical protein
MLKLLILTLIVLLFFVKQVDHFKGYYVQDKPDKQEAADTIRKIVNALNRLTLELYEERDKYDAAHQGYIEAIYDQMDEIVFRESDEGSNLTSYSVNKGEEVVFCIRSKKDHRIHDFNLLMYVAVHELAHIACPEVGHTELFFDINRFLLKRAVELGIYTPVDYQAAPTEYCGMTLNSQILR